VVRYECAATQKEKECSGAGLSQDAEWCSAHLCAIYAFYRWRARTDKTSPRSEARVRRGVSAQAQERAGRP